jgi:hypothetical protein
MTGFGKSLYGATDRTARTSKIRVCERVVLWVPPIARLFAFGSPKPGAMAVGALATLLAIVWFEVVKRVPGAGVAATQ